MTRWSPWIAAAILIGIISWAQSAPPPAPNPPGPLQYSRDIRPILSAACFNCHGPDENKRKGGLRLDTADGAYAPAKSGGRAIVPKDARTSELVKRIFSTGKDRMPPASAQVALSETEKQQLKRWVEAGGEYQQHWAFVPVQRPPVPPTRTRGWARNTLDHFVLAWLEAEGLQPSPEADRWTLARRVSLDLTGLPPTLEAVDRFVADPSPDAYEKFVDQVLRSPAYGERWAQVWLDLARYADSNGYATDNPRTIWQYRDWVIDAVNANKPFDQFTIEQLAGDLLPNPTQDQVLATAFHRNTLTNDEGGTNDEEFRVAAVVDRVNTTMQVWMGITMVCANCHNHKYDPISQEEYFRMFAIFNQSEDADKGDNSPLLTFITPEQQKKKASLDAEIARLEQHLNRSGPEFDAALRKWESSLKPDAKLPANVQAILKVERGQRGTKQQEDLARYYRTIAPELRETRDQLAALRKHLAEASGISTPIMKELPEGKRRTTRIHIRGNFLDQGKEVTPGLPALFPPPPPGQPLNRLTLARWLVDPKNPLPARVAVNRYWEQSFGVGLVDTPEDYGIRGKLPNHPELLDWLAADFMAQGWDVKKFLRLLVTSAAYRQSSRVTPALLERDPDNRLFARGPRFRSSAEVIRDQSLFVSGLLSPKMHGPPVRPPRPKMGLTAAFGGGTDWDASPGDDKFRRALYTQWRRTTPYPSMTTFDAPSRNVCAVTRPRTNTPLQALVTLNDPCYVEAAQALARRIVKEGDAAIEAKVRHAFRLCLTRPPTDKELGRLVELYRKAREDFARNSKEALALATEPLGPIPAEMDTVDLAAWTVVSNVLLNLDEMFAKR